MPTIKLAMVSNQLRIFTITVVVVLLMSLVYPVTTHAISNLNVVISELQTTDDVVELTNNSEDTVDLSGWALQTKSTSSTSNWIQRFVFPADTLLYPSGSILVTAEGYLSDLTDFHLAFNMSAERGHIRLVDDSSVPVEHDKVGWGEEAFDAEELPAVKPLLEMTLQRTFTEDRYIDTDNNFQDFVLLTPTFSAANEPPEVIEHPEGEEPVDNEEVLPEDPEPPNGVEDPDNSVENEPEVLPEVDEDPETSPPMYLNIYINEFLPDPESPLLDADDEWIELYNPHPSDIDLTGYTLKTGANSTYSYTLPQLQLPALSYIVVTSKETNLTLSNSGGAVRIFSPSGELIDERVYSDVKEGWSYMKNSDGQWFWTTTPTQAQVNIYTTPTIAQKTVKVAAAKTSKASTAKPKAASTKKATAVKTASKKKTEEARTVYEEPAAIAAQPPLHPVILAGGAILALLYGVYEYRSDLRNFSYRLSSYRNSRRKNRP